MASAMSTDRKPELPETEELKVFISYSRQDMAFAKEIVAGLQMFGSFEVSIDTEAIHEGEDWKIRLGALIAGADTVVFILTPKSAASTVCQWEVEEAERLSKRILPVQAEPLVGIKPPQQLSSLNYVRFDPHDDGRPRSFMEGLAGLRRALKENVGWLREHTRYLVRAREWMAASRADNRLLSGGDIALAKTWLAERPKDAPAPTELHHDFISASETAEEARLSAERRRTEALQLAVRRTRRALVVAVVLALLAAGAGGLAFLQQQAAVKSRDEALMAQSQYLADTARKLTNDDSDPGTALLLALEALRDENGTDEVVRTRPYWPPAEVSLEGALRKLREKSVLRGHSLEVNSVAITADGSRVVTGARDYATIWDIGSGAEVTRLEAHASDVTSVAVTPDGRRVVTGSADGTARIGEPRSQIHQRLEVSGRPPRAHEPNTRGGADGRG